MARQKLTQKRKPGWLAAQIERLKRHFYSNMRGPTPTQLHFNRYFQAQPAGGPDNRYDRDLPGQKPANRYTVEEVKRYLRNPRAAQGGRAEPVLHQAAHLEALLNIGMRRHFRGRERLFDRMQYVVSLYTQGQSADDIAKAVSFFADGSDVEDTMNFAATLIARRVNKGR